MAPSAVVVEALTFRWAIILASQLGFPIGVLRQTASNFFKGGGNLLIVARINILLFRVVLFYVVLLI